MRIIFWGILSVLVTNGFSQTPDSAKISNDIRFVKHLIGTHQYSDAIYLLDQIDFNRPGCKLFYDSLNYLKAWSLYSSKQLDSASVYFLRTNVNTNIGVKSRFYAAYNFLYQRQDSLASKTLSEIPATDPQLQELRYIQQAGIELLNRNYKGFNQIKNNFTGQYYALTDAEDKLNGYGKLLSEKKYKSPWIAGGMSMIIPGSGKMYSGKIGEGVSALLSHAILAGITIENYRKAGPSDFKTIFFGSLFSIFYLGNIYGSVISVQVVNDEFNTIYDNKILFDIHIPLRTLFN